VSQLVLLLTADFAKLSVMGYLIATPLAYFTMQKWLENFAYRANVGVTAIVLTCVSGLLITWLAVSYQSLRAAIANPIEALRDE
ncbi:ABC transporter permease, partial [bacterium]|nr:ABC transporter permease [bacterium]